MSKLLAQLVLGPATIVAVAFGQRQEVVDQVVAGPFQFAVGVALDHHGTIFVWERFGRVLWVEEGGAPEVLIDLSEEVGSWSDHGLLGFALDPDFELNGHIYLYYVVDHHHLVHFGTPSYDPDADEYGIDTIARVTRYTVLDAHQLELGVDPASRRVLIGESISTGIPICGSSHGVGSLVFGEDGTLLVSAGDGYIKNSSGTALAEGIIRPAENVDSWRAQLVDGHNGKIMRIDPETGDGLPSNPNFDPRAPRAPRSRMWALGLRNPFRFGVRPGTGASSPSVGDPGTLYIGDVGQGMYEELSIAIGPGANFGWPYFVGHWVFTPFVIGLPYANLDAPNPLFGPDSECNRPYYLFRDLMADDGLFPATWPDPCIPGAQIPSRFTQRHVRSELIWMHDEVTSYWKTYDRNGMPTFELLGTPGATVLGSPFSGRCAIGGIWPSDVGLPLEYHGTYFFADYTLGWIRNAVFDANDRLVEVREFAETGGAIVALATHPEEGGIYYVDFIDDSANGASTVRRISFDLDGLPIADVTPAIAFGPEPLTVAFDATGSTDPELGVLAFEWDFGDGTPASRRAQPVHVFPSEDATLAAALASRLDELPPSVPAPPTGPAGVAVDGAYPPSDATDPLLCFSTFHVDGNGLPAKGGVDWVGLAFPSARLFYGLVFQEGLHFPGEGGWFQTLDIEVRDGGSWVPVSELSITPPYAGFDGEEWEVHEISFAPAAGDAIRIVGAPGGTLEFVTVAELRAVAAPLAPVGAPAGYAVTLTATDAALQSDQTSVNVSINNTPPVVSIALPPNGATYSNGGQILVDLAGSGSDAEHGPGELTCEWSVVLHHNIHVHPEEPIESCIAQALLLPHGLEGDALYYELVFTVSDPLGLLTTKTHWLVPDDDCNLNGRADAEDLLFGYSFDVNRNGKPDECEGDCDANGTSDTFELVAGIAHDCNSNGVPDGCERLPDCDDDGRADPCAIALFGVQDLDANGVPDACQVLLLDYFLQKPF